MPYVVPAVLGFFLKAALTPGDADDDDPEELAKKLAANQIDYLMGLMVVVREFGEAVKTVTGANDMGRDYTGALKLEVANAITNKEALGAAGQAFLTGAGITTDAARSAWAAAVLAKASAYAQVAGLAEKMRDAARAAVKAAADEASLKTALEAQRAAADAAVASLTQPAR